MTWPWESGSIPSVVFCHSAASHRPAQTPGRARTRVWVSGGMVCLRSPALAAEPQRGRGVLAGRSLRGEGVCVRRPSAGFAGHPWTSVLTVLGLSFPRCEMTHEDWMISKAPLAPTDLGVAPGRTGWPCCPGWGSGEVGRLVAHLRPQGP